MFSYAYSFNQDLTDWCVSYFNSMPPFFVAGNTTFQTTNHPIWGTCT